MSLDVYLESPPIDLGGPEPYVARLYNDNITHNLGPMAEAFGLYVLLWRPEECGIDEAWQLIDLLVDGLDRLAANQGEAGRYAPANGYGTYAGLLNFVQKYLEACRAFPRAKVRACR